MTDGPAAPLPSFTFATATVPREARFATWAALLAGYEMSLPQDDAAEAFEVTATAWQVGGVRITAGQMGACNSHRSNRLRRRDGDDSYAVHVLDGGTWQGQVDGEDFGVGAGQPILVDHSCQIRAAATKCRYVSLDLPRDVLDEVLPPDCQRHGAILRGAAGSLLTEHLRGLSRSLPNLRPEQAPLLGSATRDLLAACLAPNRDRIARAQPQLDRARLCTIRRFIERGLWDAALSPQSIAQTHGLSRSTLYRMFEPVGGISAYITGRRLMEAKRVLSDPADKRRISDISASLGFNGEAQFSRAFRRQFGVSPSEVRAAVSVPSAFGLDTGDVATQYQAWLSRGGWVAW